MKKNSTIVKSTALAAGFVIVLVFLLPSQNADAQISVSGGVSVSAGFSFAGNLVIKPLPLPPPAPAPVIVATPPAVIVAPAPPVVVAPAPAVIIVQKNPVTPPPKVVVKAPPFKPLFEKQFGFGLMAHGVYLGHDKEGNEGMGGAGLLTRLRLLPHFATELAIGAYGGNGYDGEKRLEVPVTLGLMWMPMNYLTRVQFYTIGGLGTSIVRVGEDSPYDKPIYLGGFLGVGLELKFGAKRNVALFADLRGFMRKRMNDRPNDPLVPDGGSCRGEGFNKECTDWEGGMVMNLGIVFYF